MDLILQKPVAEDYLFAKGITFDMCDLCSIIFEYLDLIYRDYVPKEVNTFRANDAAQLVGNATKVREKLRWENKIDFQALVLMLVDADINFLK